MEKSYLQIASSFFPNRQFCTVPFSDCPYTTLYMLIHFFPKTPGGYEPKSSEKPKKYEIGGYTHVTFSRGAGGPKNHVFAYFEW